MWNIAFLRRLLASITANSQNRTESDQFDLSGLPIVTKYLTTLCSSIRFAFSIARIEHVPCALQHFNQMHFQSPRKYLK